VGQTKEMYDEEIQTDQPHARYSSDEESGGEEDTGRGRNYRKSATKSKTNKKGGFDLVEPEKKTEGHGVIGGDVLKDRKVVISDEYKKQILGSSEMAEFLQESSKKILRVCKY
jgi:hypothetical protein